MSIHANFLASLAQLRNQSVYVGNPSPQAASDPAIHPLWPEFPRNSKGTIHGIIMNGVQTITEEWDCNASASDVLSYYREQMTARGWRDATEETYNLQQELRAAANNRQNDLYADNYRNVMDSNLMFERGEWSLHIGVEPSMKVFGERTTVKFYAAATPSIKNIFAGMESPFEKHPGQPNQPLDAVQQSGGQTYHTTIVTKNKAPAQAFQEALENLGAQGWKPVVYLPKQSTRPGNFAWLVRGKEYAALSVKALPQGRTSSVTLTEVTPAK
jgi:hypothetical protein